MRVFLFFAFFLTGMVLGAAMGGFGGVLFGAIAGMLVFSWIDRSGRLAAPAASLPDRAEGVDDLRRELAQLRQELAVLAAKVERLEGVSAVPDTDGLTLRPVENVPSDVTIPDLPPPEAVFDSPATVKVDPAAQSLETAQPPFPGEEFSANPDRYAPVIEATPRPPVFEILKTWLFGGNALVRVGVVVLFFGLAFLAKFAAEHAVLPIEARYIGIGIAAWVVLGLGWRLRTRRPEYAMALQGLGVASLYLAVFAAFRLHGLVPAGLAVTLLLAICVLSAILAVLQDARSMAIVGICGGFLAPVLASTGGGNHVFLFSYYALLDAGIIGIAWFKAWRPLNVLGFLLTFGIGSLWAAGNYRDALFTSTEPFLLLFFGMYLAIALLYASRRNKESSRLAIVVGGERIDYVDATLVFGNPLAAFGLQYLMVKDMPYGSAFSALALGVIYLPLAAVLHRRWRDRFRLLVESFLALGAIFASLAIPLGLDAKWTSAAWAVEGAGIFWIGLRQGRRAARAFALLLQSGSAISLALSLKPAIAENMFGLVPVFDGSWLGPMFVGAAAVFTAWLMRGRPDRLTRSEAALAPFVMVGGLGLMNLAFPMFLDLSWSGLAVAIAGAAILYGGQYYGHSAALAFGALAQLLGGLAFGAAVSGDTPVALFNPFWLGSLAIAAAGVFSGWRLQRSGERHAGTAVLGLVWALLWWFVAGHEEITRHVAGEFVLSANIGLAALTAVLSLSIGRRLQWPAAELAAMGLLPALLILALAALAQKDQPFSDGGWLAWPAAIAVIYRLLRLQESRLPANVRDAGHALALWLAGGLATWQGWWWFHELGQPGSAWPVLGWALSPMAILALLNCRSLHCRWPLAMATRGYQLAAIPVAAGLWLWVLFANATSDGGASPLPYLPIANPLDLASAGALLVMLAWLARSAGDLDGGRTVRTVKAVLAATAFYWLNGALLRTLHHWAEVPFDFQAMMRSTIVQASLSLFWTAIALGLMLFATRRYLRTLWLVGGGLLACVVAKLFVVDLSRVGTIERIVSFIGVGILLLVIGYFSPVPPKREERP